MPFARHSLQTFFTRSAVFLAGILISVINARWLGPQGLGILTLLLLIQIFAFRFGNLGFGSALAYFTARKDGSLETLLKVAWLLTFVMSIASCAFILSIKNASFSPWKGTDSFLIYLSLPTVPALFLKNMLSRILSGQLRITVINLSEIIQTLTSLIFLIILVVFFDLHLLGAIIAVVSAQAAGLIYLIYKIYSGKKDLKNKHDILNIKFIGRLWSYGNWNYFSMLASFFLEQLPLILLPQFATISGVGFFSQARNLSMRTRMITEPFSKMLFPYTATSKGQDGILRTNMLCRVFSLIMLFTCLCLLVITKPLVLILYGKEFLRTVTLFYALMPALLCWPISQFLGVHIAASGAPKLVFMTNLGGVISAVIMCFFLIPSYGDFGAAISVSGIFVILTCLRVRVYQKLTGAALADMFLPTKSDLSYCRKSFHKARHIFSRRHKSSY